MLLVLVELTLSIMIGKIFLNFNIKISSFLSVSDLKSMSAGVFAIQAQIYRYTSGKSPEKFEISKSS